MVKILLGIILFLVGFGILAKTEWMLSNFGRIDFFEQHLGTEGGSRLGYKIIAIIITFVGIILITGLYDSFMGWMFGPLIKMMGGGGF
jgi:multisubunit Na+/H+ antiporter MnhB subunit